MGREPLTPETMQAYLTETLVEKFSNVQIRTIAVSKPDGSAEWLIEITSPVKFVRVFRPGLIGAFARAQLLASEIEQALRDRGAGETR